MNARMPEPDFSAQEPWIFRRTPVPHYYGDIVRQLFIAAAAFLLVGAPFYASDLPAELAFDVLGALVLVCLAAFTSPQGRMILLADTVVAGVGMLIFEYWALANYQTTPIVAVILRQAIALIFLFAFYFAGKTLRGLSHVMDEDAAEREASFRAERAAEEGRPDPIEAEQAKADRPYDMTEMFEDQD